MVYDDFVKKNLGVIFLLHEKYGIDIDTIKSLIADGTVKIKYK